MKSMIVRVDDHNVSYDVLAFVCPGCTELDGGTGLHMLPINTDQKKPAWTWDGDLEKPTLTPSILTGKTTSMVCHSFLKEGIFQFLGDCTHSFKNQYIEIPDLPDWFIEEQNGS